MEKSIQIPEGTKYLSEHLQDLPYNCIFDKGLVGCGGTTIAITNNQPYIISVPFLSLIENKCNQHSNLFAVTSKTSIKEIVDYLQSVDIPKVICTYDSLCKLTEVIETNLNPKDYRLLIDEYHLLFTSYSFRHEAVRCVLDNYTKFKSYCFMTATVLEDEFILTELSHIPKVEAIWSNVKEVTVASYKCETNVINTVAHVITKHLSGELKGNAYFFVNSVQFIKETILFCNLDETNTRAIWSKHNKVQMPISLGKTIDSPRKINFFTSTCFEGVDLYDENAVIYIISDKTKSNTLVDISTAFQQIACRVRNTKYWDKIYHIYTSTRYDVALSYEEFKQESKKTIQLSNQYLDYINKAPEGFANLFTSLNEAYYIAKRGDEITFDENLVKIDLYNFKITRCLYKLRVNLTKEYQNHKFKVQEYTSLIKKSFKISNVFKEVVEECEKGDIDYLNWAFNKYDFLEVAVKYLGYKKMKELKYSPKTIKRYCMKYTHISKEEKVKKLCNDYFQTGLYYDNTTIKNEIQEIYNSLEIEKTAKASDIINYKKVKVKQKMIKGVVTNGYIILN